MSWGGGREASNLMARSMKQLAVAGMAPVALADMHG